jgi:hypothetical protein
MREILPGEKTLLLCFLCAAAIGVVPQARADGEAYGSTAAPQSSPVDQSSANFKKTKRFIPGEEVVTSTGKKVKVWSTEGPVPVSRAPQPFEDPAAARVPDVHIVVDEDEGNRHDSPRGNAAQSDSFIVGHPHHRR